MHLIHILICRIEFISVAYPELSETLVIWRLEKKESNCFLDMMSRCYKSSVSLIIKPIEVKLMWFLGRYSVFCLIL